MEGELEILDSLRALQYDGKCSNDADLAIALKGGIRNEDFRGLVVWLTEELHVLRKTDEKLSIEVDDPSEFAMELSALLKELGCPYNEFVMGSLSERYETMESRLQLLDYLITEIMASKMCWKLHPVDNSYVISKSTTNTAKALEQISRDLQVGKPPESITPKALFDKLNFKVEETVRERKHGILSEPLFNTKKSLTENQWKMLERIHNDLDTEYNLRRQVLLTRLEVTIQSFQWSDKMKSREQEIIERYESKRNELESLKLGGIDTNIVALLAAREDLAIIEKTSSANVRKNTASKIQKHVIGSVPDRGGRANEHAPPPPEMPSWQQQRATGPGGRGGNFRGGGGNNRGAGNNRGGGGHWQQFSAPPQQQRFVQQPQFEQDRDQTLVSGSGRVQGSGWTQKGYDFNDGSERRDAAGYYNNSYQGGPRGRGNSNYRGRSNYNRGGQRH